jgi:hypothetical protein
MTISRMTLSKQNLKFQIDHNDTEQNDNHLHYNQQNDNLLNETQQSTISIVNCYCLFTIKKS